ncbi:MAG: argininosuccinate synthase [Deltaproteobacteria bacterium]|nr:argininosuccinate synthase [Deltaproteobacteria bacterium]MCZ6822661.1 argininosuccinate synthase [Deltaproteobacteria bacterium]TDI97656.1 MAG: argininosuccinate synthase [Deltaproteobacteria bacterium]
MSDIRRIVLAYSGGLDTSVILRWLIETYEAEVVCYVGDVGQQEDLAETVRKAMATGAKDCVVRDLREEFVRDYVFQAVAANALYEGTYLLGTSLARPVLAREQVRVAREVGADALAHGCTGKGNDQMRFELAYRALAPELSIVAPWREWDLGGRKELMAYAQKFDIPVETSLKKPYSIDRNLYHISYEGGVLEDPWRAPDADMFEWTTAPELAPDVPTELELEFECGRPRALNGKALGPVDLLRALNDEAATHGVGRVDLVENRAVGIKSRGVYETPGGTVLHLAHRALESITLDREVMLERDRLIPRFAQLIYNGFWFSPEMEFLSAAINVSQRHVSGSVRVRLYKGSVTILGRRSPESLYREDLATFEADEAYDQRDAGGFIRLNALRLQLRERPKS